MARDRDVRNAVRVVMSHLGDNDLYQMVKWDEKTKPICFIVLRHFAQIQHIKELNWATLCLLGEAVVLCSATNCFKKIDRPTIHR